MMMQLPVHRVYTLMPNLLPDQHQIVKNRLKSAARVVVRSTDLQPDLIRLGWV